MEHLLYQKVFEKASGIKSANSLGEVISFLIQDIERKASETGTIYKVINERTLKRGFKEYLDPELLRPFERKNKKNDTGEEKKDDKKYVPNLFTLNVLAAYLGCENFADFSAQNKTNQKAEDLEPEELIKSNVNVYQYGSNSVSYRDIRTEGDITFNL